MSNMHQGLDLSRFKKVSSDKKTTTLRHAKGHEIKIAHSGLTPKMKERLDALPAHMAEGGDVPDPLTETRSAPEEPTEAQPLDNESPAVAADAPPVAAEPEAPEAPATAMPEPPSVPAAAPAVAAAPSMAQHLKEQDQMTANDLALGHIKPQTYADLFAKKDTLGKIGTLFGMLLSGAGSGLSHQPNAVMEMMNKQIDQDFDAQKSSAVNAQNFLRLHQQHEMNQAQIKQMGVQNALTTAQTGAIPSQIARTEAETGKIGFENKLTAAQARDLNLTAEAKTKMLMNRAAFHKLVVDTQNMPEGPAKAQAIQTLGMMSQAVNAENFDIADRAAAMSALSGALNPPEATPGVDPEKGFNSVQQQLRLSGQSALAEDREARHFPGIPGQASVKLTPQDRSNIEGSQALMGSLERLKAFSKANPNPPKGSKADIEGKALAAQVQGDFRLATHGGVFKEGEQNFISQVVPGDPTAWSPFAHVVDKIDTVINETKARNDQFLKSKGFPVAATAAKEKQKNERKTWNGKTYERGPNGESVEVKARASK